MKENRNKPPYCFSFFDPFVINGGGEYLSAVFAQIPGKDLGGAAGALLGCVKRFEGILAAYKTFLSVTFLNRRH